MGEGAYNIQDIKCAGRNVPERVYIFLADGFEEIEGLTVVDLLRRAGIDTVTVSVMGRREITGSHRIVVLADELIENVTPDKTDMLVLPGGMPGTLHLGACESLVGFLKAADERKSMMAAICAAPTLFGKLGFLEGKKAICYPGMEDELIGAAVTIEPVVTDGHITTSRGLGTAIPFALRLIALILGQEKADTIAESIVYV